MKQKSIYKIVNIETGEEDYGNYTLMTAHASLMKNFELRPILRTVPVEFVKVFMDGKYQWGSPDGD